MIEDRGVVKPNQPTETQSNGVHDEIGSKLRAERERHGLSLRKLAGRLEISPSALSQIELGRSRPSVRTLYAIVSELGISLDELLGDGTGGGANPSTAVPEPRSVPYSEPAGLGMVTRAGERSRLDLESGAHWQRLNPRGDRDVDFLESTYDVGGASSPDGMFTRHGGREYGLVLSGRLKVTVGFEEYELGPGDSICFDSQIPHRLETVGDENARTVWFVVGRGSDTRGRWSDRAQGAAGA